MTAIFPVNPTLVSAEYNSATETLAVFFRKGQTRTYEGVPITTAYRLAYAKDPNTLMHIYSTEIRKKFIVSVK